MNKKLKIQITGIGMLLMSFVSVYGRGPQQWLDISKDSLSATMEALNSHFAHMHNYSVKVTDESFASYTASTFHQKFSGYFKRDGESFHSYLGDVNTIQNKDYRISVDSVKKIIMISDPVDYLNQILTASDYSALLKVCTKVKISHTGDQSSYRLEFASGYPMIAYEITLKDSLPEKIVIYYSKAVKGANENISAKPRMEIYFNNWVTNAKVPKSEFNAEKYLSKQGNKFILNPPYSAAKYKLLDERVLTRKNKK
ncbi:MAG TPA: hypothetical protein VNY36_01685 [Bacteroidia bacterium]|jgi:hypothetical protein|nr:hypothetical protein [Bacteroidia bacterium]